MLPPPTSNTDYTSEFNSQTIPSRQRISNVELLRIVAMFGVVILHLNFGTFGIPDRNEIISSPISETLRILLEAICVCATNVFVLISGYFGIRFKIKSLLKLLFQCAFFFFGIWIIMMLLGKESFSINNLMKCLMLPNESSWFVKCYLGLYVLAPVLNRFVDSCGKKEFITVLISFYTLQTTYGWITNATDFIASGFSAYSFIGLYLLGRYINRHKPAFAKNKLSRDILFFTLMTLVITAMIFVGIQYNAASLEARALAYSNPIVIAQAVYLLLTFLKFHISSSIINWIAASCFAVFLGHFMIFKYVEDTAIRISETSHGIAMAAMLMMLTIVFFSACILTDKIRIAVWNQLSNSISKFHNKASL